MQHTATAAGAACSASTPTITTTTPPTNNTFRTHPARPFLASTVLHSLRLERGAQEAVASGEERPRRLRTGCADVDDGALRGGLVYGSGGVVGVACGDEGVGGEFALSALTTHLLESTSSTRSSRPVSNAEPPSPLAYYIDTPAHPTFFPRRLHALLTARLKRQRSETRFTHDGGYMYHPQQQGATETTTGPDQQEEEVEVTVNRVMDRVALLRVFDFAGLVEAVGEVDARVIGGRSPGREERASEIDRIDKQEDVVATEPRAESRGLKRKNAEFNIATSQGPSPERVQNKRAGWRERGLVMDSQATQGDAEAFTQQVREEESEARNYKTGDVYDDQDEEMQDSTPSPPIIHDHNHDHDHDPEPSTAAAPTAPPAPPLRPEQTTHDPSQPILLILASMPRLLSPLMRRNHVQGHALLAHLGRRLAHLTRSANVCVLLLNTTVGGGADRSPAAVMAALGTLSSAFADVSERPALGRTWPWFVDVGLLITWRGGKGGRGLEKNKSAEEGGWVVEVLADRFQDRVGCWGVFAVEA